MSEIVTAVAASHATAMRTRWDETDDMQAAERFMEGLQEAKKSMDGERLDALVVVGSNHFQGFFLDMMPAFAIGAGECLGLGDGGSPEGPLPVDPTLARDLAWGLSERDFDVALSLKLELDHGITQCLQYLTPELDVPIVPIVINTFTPPLPSMKRCFALGQALRDIIDTDGQNRRIGLVASGGLSHHLPFMVKWYAEISDDQRVLVDSLYRQAPMDEFHVKRLSIMEDTDPFINEEFDERFMQLLVDQDWDTILAYSSEELEDVAGNASQEIKAWVVVAAAAGGAANKLAYSPMYEWFTGMGVATFDVA